MNAKSVAGFILLPLAAMLSAACQPEDSKPSIVFEGGSNPSPVFASSGGSLTIEFTSSLDWTATSSEDWLTPDKESGQGGKCSVTLEADENEDFSERTAKVSFVSKSLSTTVNKTISVTQSQKDVILTDISSANLTWEGGDINVDISSNVDFKIRFSAVWIYEIPETKALSNTGRTFRADPNWTKDARSATIRFTAESGGLESLIEVTQDANPDPGTGEDTPFTLKCSEIGSYSGTDGDSPVCDLPFSGYQYAFGSDSGRQFFRYTDFIKGVLTSFNLSSASLSVGGNYTMTTSRSDNGNMVKTDSENLTLVSLKSGMIWLENKKSRTGYIIPIQ